MASINPYDETIASIKSVEFTILGNNEIKNMSAVISEPNGIDIAESYDNLEPKRGGVIDTRLGITDNYIECGTCGMNAMKCPGHFGHIELAEPVFHVGFLPLIRKILRCICIKCSKLLIHKNEKDIDEMLKTKSNKARFAEIVNLCKNVPYCQKANYGCGAPVPKIRVEQKKSSSTISIVAETKLNMFTNEEGGQTEYKEDKKIIKQMLTPEVCYDILKNISDTDCRIIGLDPDKCRPENMIMKQFPVPPVPVRPSIKLGALSSTTLDDDLTHKIGDIIKTNVRIRKNKDAADTNKYTNDMVNLLQYHVATFYDNDTLSLPKAEQRNGKAVKSVSSRLKGKEGRIRGSLMGKRVDFSARTVITSDPNIGIEHLGVPIKMAMNLTFPEIVTPGNIEYLSKLIQNGRVKYPGANFIIPIDKDGSINQNNVIDLRYRKKPYKLKYGDRVERHLVDGDIVLFNRQPSLHKVSMMAHIIKVVNDPSLSTFRLNVGVTTPYNADFDGDEMNMHVPQSIQTATELSMIAAVPKQIITLGKSAPIIGSKQDTLMGAYKMTNDNTKINWRHAMNIIMHTSITNKNIIKKNVEYTGKELFSLIIPDNINISGGGIKINKAKLEQGLIGKKHIGTSKNNIIHKIWYRYGADKTKNFINDTQKLIVNWLLYKGYTISPKDFDISNEIKEKLANIIESKRLEVNHLLTEVENNPDLMDVKLFEDIIKSELQNINSTQIDKMVMSNLPEDNHLYICINSGSNGTEMNAGQTMIALGQQSIERERVKKRYNKRTLPHFHQNDDSAFARGFCSSSFMKGLLPSEFFFHTMAGREGVIDTAIKTADTGYIQRKLIKALEDIMVKYDGTVRNANDIVVQFAFGGNNINAEYQIEQKISIVSMSNKDIESNFIYSDSELNEINKGNKKTQYTKDINNAYYKLLTKSRDLLRIIQRKSYVNYITVTEIYNMPIDLEQIIQDEIRNKSTNDNEIVSPYYVYQQIEDLLDSEDISIVFMNKAQLKDKSCVKNRDNRDAKTLFNILIYEYLAPKKCTHHHKLTKNMFDSIIMRVKNDYRRALIDPAEMVGTIAAQSIGEPATQLTLNTFHFTGTGKGSQSLGVPRLKEILSITKNLKTPAMVIPLVKNLRENKKMANKIASYIKHTIIDDLIQKIDIRYDPNPFSQGGFMEEDDVENLFQVYNQTKSSCQSDIDNLPWLIRLELNKEKMLEKDVTLLDIKSKFCYNWSRRYDDIKNTKSIKKNILDKVTQCAILSNYDNSPTPIIHIRADMNNFDYSTLINFKDFVLGFKLKGVSGINEIDDINHERLATFDDDGSIVNKQHHVIYTSGVNLIDIRYINGIDYNKIVTNDIVQIYDVYGIEAARTSIIKEIKKVVEGGGSQVNPQWLSLLVDVMVNTGTLTAINRHGINKLDTDPFSRASFEKTIEQLLMAAVFNEKDHMRSVSARIMAGKAFAGGTGLCDLILEAETLINTEDVETDNNNLDQNDIIDFTDNNLIKDMMAK
jgi:DNA-directed RNA polymerase II subunit RPB1